MIRNFGELYQYRGLLLSLVQRELKARYRGSVLGFFWTFLSPTLQMCVYALVFSFIMRQQIEHYAYFMFVGLLPWLWFATSVNAGASAISDRRDLLTKVWFPAQVLPATVVITNLCNYLLSLPLLVMLGLFFGRYPSWHMLLLPLVVLIQLCFTLAVVYIVSALNVTFRDLQHIVANLMTMWMFLTPVLYSTSAMPPHYRAVVLMVNPMAIFMSSYQAICYEQRVPEMLPLAVVLGLSVGLLWVASALFESRREEFAESI